MKFKKFLTIISIMCGIFIVSCPVFAFNKNVNSVNAVTAKVVQLDNINSSFDIENSNILQVTNKQSTKKEDNVIASDSASNKEDVEEGDSLKLTIMVVAVLVIGVSLFVMAKKKK